MKPASQFVVLWQFEVTAAQRAGFERIYGPTGDWAQLFRRDPAYRGTELLHGTAPGIYLTVDRWDSADAYARFKAAHAADYTALDRRCETLTTAELKLGEFWTVTTR